jgi:DNA-directed RNA polymerase specialized sigma24 family protein
MNQEYLTELVTYAQAGDSNALEPLLMWAYTPVSFLCQKLLKDSHIAQTQTREILQAICHKLPSLQSPAVFEKWVIRLTAARCVQIQNQNTWMDDEEVREEELPIIGESLDEMQTVEAVQKMVDMLPLKPRTCMMLLCCCEMNSSGIAQLTGYSVEEVRQNMSTAQTFVLEQLQKYQDLGTEFYPITSLTDVLQSGMRYEREEDALPVVYDILGKEIPTPAEPNRAKKSLLLAVMIALIFINLVLGGLNLLVKHKNTISPEDYSAAEVTVPTAATEPEVTAEPAEEQPAEETEEAQETGAEEQA